MGPLIPMCGALSRNTSRTAGVEILLANCLAHGRRQFVVIAPSFPDECRQMDQLHGWLAAQLAENRATCS